MFMEFLQEPGEKKISKKKRGKVSSIPTLPHFFIDALSL